MEKESRKIEYDHFQENGNWGLKHRATGKIVIPAIYRAKLNVSYNTGIVKGFLGGELWHHWNVEIVLYPDECHILVLNGEQAQIVVSGYQDWENTGPSVITCTKESTKQKDTFKILRMPNYIAIIKNAVYEKGFISKEGEFSEKSEYSFGPLSIPEPHAKYLSGGIFSAIGYDGKDIPVTEEIKKEISNVLESNNLFS